MAEAKQPWDMADEEAHAFLGRHYVDEDMPNKVHIIRAELAAMLRAEQQWRGDALRLLRELEWAGVLVREGVEFCCCPYCSGLPVIPESMHPANQKRCFVGHHVTCRLAALLNAGTSLAAQSPCTSPTPSPSPKP